MRGFRDTSINTKLNLLALVTGGVAVSLLSGAFILENVLLIRSSKVANLSTLACILGSNSTAALTFDDAAAADELLRSLSYKPTVRYACLYDPQGKVFAEYQRDPTVRMTPPPLGPEGHEFRSGGYLDVTQRIVKDGELVGTVYVRATMDDLNRQLAYCVTIVVVGMVVSLGIAFAMSFRLQRSVGGPIVRLAQVTQQISAERDYSLRVKKEANDELGVLYDDFNAMLDQIQRGERELYDAQNHLELRVEERTRELSEANEELARQMAERWRAEQKLQREKGVSDDIINSLPGLFYIFDGERFVRWNKKWETTTGYSAEEIRGMYGPDFFEGADKLHIIERMQTVFRVGEADAEASILTKDGRKIPFYFTGLRSIFDGTPHLLGFAIDITDRKRAEEQLKHYTAELESSNLALTHLNHLAEAATRAKSEFLANMSHEIRTPITAILGYADIAIEESVGLATCEHVRVIKRNGEHLLGVINDILDLSKVEARQMQIEPIRCSPVQLAAEVMSLMRVRAEAKHVRLHADLVSPLPETILTDPLRLRQVLVNLVGNAIKFTDLGEVCLAVRLISDTGRTRLRFDVIDTGIGMNEEQIGRLFRAFSQVDNSSARKFGGTGLGLCISKHLAEALGGCIEVRSEPGKGSTFSLTIDPGSLDGVPMIENTQEALLERSSTTTAVTADKIQLHGRVLLAEDGPDNQRLIAFLLKRAGAEVTLAENGQIAYEIARAAVSRGEPFDVILMDMQMPVMDGYSATRRLRTEGYTGPIIALTAHAMADDREKCLDAGCDDYTTKPIDRQTLLATVAKWMAGTRAIESSTPLIPLNTAVPSADLGA